MNLDAKLEIDTDPKSIQRIAPPSRLERFEGIAFSPSGMIVVATSETNTVFLFRRKPDGLFEDAPYRRIGGPNSGLNYPHDVSFSACGDTELLAVAQRGGAIAIYAKNRVDGHYGDEPAFEISGPRTGLVFSDGVAFVPPSDDYLAACNLGSGTVTFYRRTSLSPVRFETAPEFELKHPSLCHPDGLAFSQCGKWLAIANHGNHSVSIFRRRNGIFSGGRIKYGPEPDTVIQDPRLRHPHSVAFTPRTRRLIVTNAGANHFSAYEPISRRFRTEWSQSPALQVIANREEAFMEINAQNKMEGGPKGVAIHENKLAVCSPEFGVKIFTFREC